MPQNLSVRTLKAHSSTGCPSPTLFHPAVRTKGLVNTFLCCCHSQFLSLSLSLSLQWASTLCSFHWFAYILAFIWVLMFLKCSYYVTSYLPQIILYPLFFVSSNNVGAVNLFCTTCQCWGKISISYRWLCQGTCSWEQAQFVCWQQCFGHHIRKNNNTEISIYWHKCDKDRLDLKDLHTTGLKRIYGLAVVLQCM